MKKVTKIVVVVLAVIAGIAILGNVTNKSTPVDGILGSDSSNSQLSSSEFNQLASASRQGLVKATSGRVTAIEVTSDSQSLRFLQLFDMVASSSAPTTNPMGKSSYFNSFRMTSFPIPAATSSASPTVVRIEQGQLGGALDFHRGLIWGMSSSFGTFSSTSVQPARQQVKILYR